MNFTQQRDNHTPNDHAARDYANLILKLVPLLSTPNKLSDIDWHDRISRSNIDFANQPNKLDIFGALEAKFKLSTLDVLQVAAEYQNCKIAAPLAIRYLTARIYTVPDTFNLTFRPEDDSLNGLIYTTQQLLDGNLSMLNTLLACNNPTEYTIHTESSAEGEAPQISYTSSELPKIDAAVVYTLLSTPDVILTNYLQLLQELSNGDPESINASEYSIFESTITHPSGVPIAAFDAKSQLRYMQQFIAAINTEIKTDPALEGASIIFDCDQAFRYPWFEMHPFDQALLLLKVGLQNSDVYATTSDQKFINLKIVENNLCVFVTDNANIDLADIDANAVLNLGLDVSNEDMLQAISEFITHKAYII